MPIMVEGVLAVEGEPTGDGRLFEVGSINWNGVLPIPIIWDRTEGDHTGPTVGSMTDIERRDGGVIWGRGYLSDSEDAQTRADVARIAELLNEGAIGGSICWDNEVAELRVKRELMEVSEEAPAELDASGERVVVARFAADDALKVITGALLRHFAILDTGAFFQAHLTIATGAIAAAGMVGDWAGREHFFDDPGFGDYVSDQRLRYDPDRSAWSCPPTLDEEMGRVFGHITPMGICLRGRPDRCVTPPDGDLEGFMRGRAPAAGGRRTGVICCGGDSSHCEVGIGAARATEHYDKVGRAVADVRVGKDRYGIWFAGMARPGASQNDLYAFAASDVSGHWEMTQRGRMTLVGLPSVNVGGFPKGFLTYQEFTGGLAAAGGITVEEGCGSWESDEVSDPVLDRLNEIHAAVGEMYAAHLRNTGS